MPEEYRGPWSKKFENRCSKGIVILSVIPKCHHLAKIKSNRTDQIRVAYS